MSYSFAAHLARFGPGTRYPVMSPTEARGYCASLTRSHYENFSVASVFLPRHLRPHFFPIYAYCRWADDLGDETGGGQSALKLLDWWRTQLVDLYAGKARHPVMIALQRTIQEFDIPATPFLELVEAFEQDQRVKTYETFEELLLYCRRSANPVGRLVLYLCRSFTERNAVLSDAICTGLQLANFWQDVERDFKVLGRIYLPQEDCRRFGFDVSDLQACRPTTAFRALMSFEVDRARQFFRAGQPLAGLVAAEIRADINLFVKGGLAILDKIEQLDFDVLTQRPSLSSAEKGRLALRTLPDQWRKLATVMHPSSLRTVRQLTHPNARSYAWCRRLTRQTAKNFYFAFLVLPHQQRRAMSVLYAFMRITDDLADEPGDCANKRRHLAEWRAALDRCLEGEYSHPLHAALHDIVRRYGIPTRYLHEVIDGVEIDLQPVRLATFTDLYAYCYRVASTVGLCCIHIWGFRDAKALQYAEAAGIAFQLTNILRDLKEDAGRGRVYLPADEINRFGADPGTWRTDNAAFREMMRFQVERARSYYARGEQLIPYLSPAGRAVFQVMLRIYRGLLDLIESRSYDVFQERVRLSHGRKFRHLLLAFPIRWGWL